jgi:hypothetical protein
MSFVLRPRSVNVRSVARLEPAFGASCGLVHPGNLQALTASPVQGDCEAVVSTAAAVLSTCGVRGCLCEHFSGGSAQYGACECCHHGAMYHRAASTLHAPRSMSGTTAAILEADALQREAHILVLHANERLAAPAELREKTQVAVRALVQALGVLGAQWTALTATRFDGAAESGGREHPNLCLIRGRMDQILRHCERLRGALKTVGPISRQRHASYSNVTEGGKPSEPSVARSPSVDASRRAPSVDAAWDGGAEPAYSPSTAVPPPPPPLVKRSDSVAPSRNPTPPPPQDASRPIVSALTGDGPTNATSLLRRALTRRSSSARSASETPAAPSAAPLHISAPTAFLDAASALPAPPPPTGDSLMVGLAMCTRCLETTARSAAFCHNCGLRLSAAGLVVLQPT